MPVTNDVIQDIIQERLMSEYGFSPHAVARDVDEGRYVSVPDGDYPMVFDDGLQMVRVRNGMPGVVVQNTIDIRNNPHGDQSGAWATLLDCCRKDGVPVYMVQIEDQVSLWPINNPAGDYEFEYLQLPF